MKARLGFLFNVLPGGFIIALHLAAAAFTTRPRGPQRVDTRVTKSL